MIKKKLFKIFIFCFSIICFTNSVFADYCSNIRYLDFEKLKILIDNKDELRAVLYNNRIYHSDPTIYLSSYDVLNNSLGSINSNILFPISVLAASCEVSPQLLEKYEQEHCPNINFDKMREILDLFYTAKFLISISSHNFLFLWSDIEVFINNVTLTNGFDLALENIKTTCDSIEIEEDRVCNALPNSPIKKFLWKPVSESNRKLVVLMNPKGVLSIGEENLQDRGPSNGRCTTARASKPGAGYGNDVLLKIQTARETVFVVVPQGSKRYDCGSKSLTDCGLVVQNPNPSPSDGLRRTLLPVNKWRGLVIYDQRAIDNLANILKGLRQDLKEVKTLKGKRQVKRNLKRCRKVRRAIRSGF